MQNHALLIDYSYCTGCHTCEIACRKEKQLPLDEWGIKLSEQGPVQIEGTWMWNYAPIPSDACDLCESRVAEGKKPACVHHCLAQCMELIHIEDLPALLVEKGKKTAVFIP